MSCSSLSLSNIYNPCPCPCLCPHRCLALHLSNRILEKSLFLVISATILPKRLGPWRDTSDCIQEKSLTPVPNVTLNESIQLNWNDTRWKSMPIKRMKPYKCDQCAYSSTMAQNLKNHKRLHSGEKPHSCDRCDYSSKAAGTLRRHKRLHTGEKPHSCAQCNFKWKHLT